MIRPLGVERTRSGMSLFPLTTQLSWNKGAAFPAVLADVEFGIVIAPKTIAKAIVAIIENFIIILLFLN
jgi:hypothetical protein